MAKGEKILHSDIIEPGDPMAMLNKGLVEALTNVEKLIKAIKVLNSNSGGKGLSDFNKDSYALNQTLKDLNKTEKAVIDTKIKIANASTSQAQVFEIEKNNLQKLNKEKKLEAEIINSLPGSYNRLNAEYRKNLNELKQMQVVNEQDRKKRQELITTINKQNSELKKLDASMGNHQRNVGNYAGSIKGVITQIAGWAGVTLGVAGAIRGLKTVINSAQGASDQFRETVSGLKFGMQQFMSSLATGDFSNFISRMQDAIKAGREYYRILDDIGDRLNEYAVAESEAKIETEKLYKVLRNVTLSDQERIDAGQKILQIETDLAQKRIDNTERQFKAELLAARTKSGLTDDEIKNYLRSYTANEQLRDQANEYLTALKNLETQQYLVNEARAIGELDQKDLEKLNNYKDIIANTSQEVKDFSTVIEGYNKLNDQSGGEIEKLTKAWVDYNNAQSSFDQTTQRVSSSINAVILSLTKKDEKEKDNKETLTALTQVEEIHIKSLERRKKTVDELFEDEVDTVGKELEVFLNSEEQKKQAREKEKQDIEDIKRKRYEAAMEISNLVSYIANNEYKMKQDAINREMEDLNKLHEHEVALAGDNLEAKSAADRKYDKEQKELKRKQAKANKENAIFNATISMLQAIVYATTAAPGPLGIVLALITAAYDAYQIASLAATPLPSFRKGLKEVKPGLGSQGTDKDGHIVQVHDGERILTKEQNQLLGGLDNDRIPGMVALGQQFTAVAPVLETIAKMQLAEQRQSNSYLRRFKFPLNTGYEDINGDRQYFVN